MCIGRVPAFTNLVNPLLRFCSDVINIRAFAFTYTIGTSLASLALDAIALLKKRYDSALRIYHLTNQILIALALFHYK